MLFKIEAKDPLSKARAGELKTGHGKIQTPVFMPVGTLGAVKAVHQKDLEEEIKARIILSNTYHLYLRPGTAIIQKAGGIHAFNSWNRPILTDSGGYQVYSLAAMRKLSEEGVEFKSHIDGSKHFFSPEKVIDVQRQIGADIIMAFDECTPYPCERSEAKKSMELTHRWLRRCCEQFDSTENMYEYDQELFPIVQGSTYKDLRKRSAEEIASYQKHGNAIGGLSVGEPAELMYEMTSIACDILPEDKPRYLMGVGTPVNILESIALGIDMFDCVMPTRNGRNGMLFTKDGILNIKNKKWENDHSLIDENSSAFTSKLYSKSFLRHLMKSNEILGAQIATLHNLSFYTCLLGEVRKHIVQGDFLKWKKIMIKRLDQRL